MFGFNEGLFEVRATLNGSFQGKPCVFQRRHGKRYPTVYIAVVHEQSDDYLFFFDDEDKAIEAWACLQKSTNVVDHQNTPFAYREVVYQDVGYGYQNGFIKMY